MVVICCMLGLFQTCNRTLHEPVAQVCIILCCCCNFLWQDLSAAQTGLDVMVALLPHLPKCLGYKHHPRLMVAFSEHLQGCPCGYAGPSPCHQSCQAQPPAPTWWREELNFTSCPLTATWEPCQALPPLCPTPTGEIFLIKWTHMK